MIVEPAFFIRLAIGNVSVESLADEYVHWAIGKGRFAKQRNRRLQMGVPAHLSVEALRGSSDHAGDNDCSLSVRRAEGVALLRMVQRDSADAS